MGLALRWNLWFLSSLLITISKVVRKCYKTGPFMSNLLITVVNMWPHLIILSVCEPLKIRPLSHCLSFWSLDICSNYMLRKKAIRCLASSLWAFSLSLAPCLSLFHTWTHTLYVIHLYKTYSEWLWVILMLWTSLDELVFHVCVAVELSVLACDTAEI